MNSVALSSLRLSKSLVLKQAPKAFVSARFYSTEDKIHPGYIKIRELYKKFQVDDGVPVHLKGGPMDLFLYYTTLLGCGVGMVLTFHYFYHAAFPKKP